MLSHSRFHDPEVQADRTEGGSTGGVETRSLGETRESNGNMGMAAD